MVEGAALVSRAEHRFSLAAGATARLKSGLLRGRVLGCCARLSSLISRLIDVKKLLLVVYYVKMGRVHSG
jgi:hypothetical protein